MDLVKFARPHHIVTVAQSVIGVKDAKSQFVGEKNMWVLLGLAAIVTALLNVVASFINKEPKYFRFASLSLTALTMCAFYSDGAKRVIVNDWAGLMDIMPGMSRALWVCVIISILINSVSLLKKGK